MASQSLTEVLLEESDSESMTLGEDRLCKLSEFGIDKDEIEANILCDVYNFLKKDCLDSGSDIEIRKSFFQNLLTKVMAGVRDDKIDAESASNIIISCAVIMGFEMNTSIDDKLLLVTGLSKMTTLEHLEKEFSKFGDINVVALASNSRGFGEFMNLCHYLMCI